VIAALSGQNTAKRARNIKKRVHVYSALGASAAPKRHKPSSSQRVFDVGNFPKAAVREGGFTP